MNIPCPSPAGLCSDPSNPFSNISSEAPDKLEFFGFNTGFGPDLPPLGSNWLAVSCVGTCVSSVSQEDADLCAARANITCLSTSWPVTQTNPVVGPPTPSGPLNPFAEGTARQIFTNEPQSCDATCPDGSPFTFTVPAGTFSAFDQTTANNEAHSYACNQAMLQTVCISSFGPLNRCKGQSISQIVTASGANTPFVFTISAGSLPPGTSMVQTGPSTALISGTPTSSGAFDFSITATDSHGVSAQKSYAINVVSIANPSPLPNASPCNPYSVTLTEEGPSLGTVSWSITGTLPDGLSFDSNSGVISGTPTTVSTTTLTVTMTTGGLSCSKGYVLNTGPGEPVAGFKICDWDSINGDIIAAMIPDPSTFPAWDGVFTRLTNDSFADQIYFFTGQSVGGNKVSADEDANWPCGGWEDEFLFGHYTITGSPGLWYLSLCPCANASAWTGTWTGPTPVGTYTTDGFSPLPNCICVDAVSGDCSDCVLCESCGSTAAAIQDVIWTQGPNGAMPPCGTWTIVGGTGTFDYTQNLSTCLSLGMEIRGTICNPGDDYDITVTIPWDDSGTVVGAAPHTAQWQLILDDVIVDSVTRDLVTGPFTDVILTGTIPGAFTTTAIRLGLVTGAVPNPEFSVFSLGHANNLTITPLTPP